MLRNNPEEWRPYPTTVWKQNPPHCGQFPLIVKELFRKWCGIKQCIVWQLLRYAAMFFSLSSFYKPWKEASLNVSKSNDWTLDSRLLLNMTLCHLMSGSKSYKDLSAFETLGTTPPSAQCHIREDLELQHLLCDSLRSQHSFKLYLSCCWASK